MGRETAKAARRHQHGLDRRRAPVRAWRCASLDIDLIDRINPFESAAYAILAKSMSEERLKQVAAVIAAKRTIT